VSSFLKLTILFLCFTLISSAAFGQWAATYSVGGREGDTWPRSVQQTEDGGYVVAGFTEAVGAGGRDIWILKLDTNGNIIWQKTYGGSGNETPYSIKQTHDGGYVVAGYTSSFGSGGRDFWILKLDTDGSVVWQKAYGGGSNETAWAIQQTDDNGYIVVGRTRSFGPGSQNAWILKLDANGSVVWQKTYGEQDDAYETCFIQQM
jgi:predicted secreted protein